MSGSLGLMMGIRNSSSTEIMLSDPVEPRKSLQNIEDLLSSIADDLDFLLNDLYKNYPQIGPTRVSPWDEEGIIPSEKHASIFEQYMAGVEADDEASDDEMPRSDADVSCQNSVISSHLDIFALEDSEKALHIPEREEIEEPAAPLSLIERLIKTHPIWYLPDVDRNEATSILRNHNVGTFLVRQSSHKDTMALSLKLNHSDPGLDHYLIEFTDKGLHVEGSNHYFPAMPLLITHYTETLDELPIQLKLPNLILKAETVEHLASLANLGQGFWTAYFDGNDNENFVEIECPRRSASPDTTLVAHTVSSPISIGKFIQNKPKRDIFQTPSGSSLLSDCSLMLLQSSNIQSNLDTWESPNELNAFSRGQESKFSTSKSMNKFSAGFGAESSEYPDTQQLDEVQTKECNFSEKLDTFKALTKSQCYHFNTEELMFETVESHCSDIRYKPKDDRLSLKSISSFTDVEHWHDPPPLPERNYSIGEEDHLSLSSSNVPRNSKSDKYESANEYFSGNFSDRLSDYEDVWTNSPCTSASNLHQLSIPKIELSKPGSESLSSISCNEQSLSKTGSLSFLNAVYNGDDHSKLQRADSLGFINPMFEQYTVDRRDVKRNEKEVASVIVDVFPNDVSVCHSKHLRVSVKDDELSSLSYEMNSSPEMLMFDALESSHSSDSKCLPPPPPKTCKNRTKLPDVLMCSSENMFSRDEHCNEPPPVPPRRRKQRRSSVPNIPKKECPIPNRTKSVYVPTTEKESLPSFSPAEDKICSDVATAVADIESSLQDITFELEKLDAAQKTETDEDYTELPTSSQHANVESMNDGLKSDNDMLHNTHNGHLKHSLMNSARLQNLHAFVPIRNSVTSNRTSFSETSTVEDLLRMTSPGLSDNGHEMGDHVPSYDNLNCTMPPLSAASVSTVFCKPWDSSLWENLLQNTTSGCRLSVRSSQLPLPNKDKINDSMLDWINKPDDGTSIYGGLKSVDNISCISLADSWTYQAADIAPVIPIKCAKATTMLATEHHSYHASQIEKDIQNDTPICMRKNHPVKEENENRVTENCSPTMENISNSWVNISLDNPTTRPVTISKFPTDSVTGRNSFFSSLSAPRLVSLKNRGKEPGIKICSFIHKLAMDHCTTFGVTIDNFIQCTTESCEKSPQVAMRNVRQFMSGIKNYLTKHGEGNLEDIIEEERNKLQCDEFLNIDAIIEGALHKCVIKPLKQHLYSLFVHHYTKNGSLELLSNNIKYAQTKTPEELGVRPGLVPPQGTSLDIINHFLKKMQRAYSPLKKLENLLGATDSIYKGVQELDGDQLKPVSCMGADDFLPMLICVLVKCNLVCAEVEADYMWGLLHQSLLNGEGGYYLTMLSSAVHVLKTLREVEETNASFVMRQSISEMQGFLKVLIPDEVNDSILSHSLPIRPNMTTKEVCNMIAHKFRITNPQDYGLFELINKQETQLHDTQLPLTIRLDLQLEGKDCSFAYKRINAKFAWPLHL
ncbi:uncharacterized protein LOC141914728 isoform X2 [Tubulanus polymorphus]|uniref:uncharacterized protein LOC141914728 isoform X2 n=1 Tax=Tubulanus polymorphus TaxID=672921 RepID=UPI003DA55998